MKFLFDLFPVILFFVAFKVASSNAQSAASLATSLLGSEIAPAQAPILLATAVTIVSTFVQVGWQLVRHRKVDRMLWFSMAIIVVLGGATLLLHDETFIKWKPTVLYWLFAAILLGGKVLFRRNLIRSMMEKQITAPEPVWDKLNLSWIGFFSIMGLVNLYFAYRFSTEIWVNFKLFGALGLMLLFVLLQGIWLAKHVEHKEESQ